MTTHSAINHGWDGSRYTDPDGDTLDVLESRVTGAVKLFASDISDGERTNITIKAADLDEFLKVLYQAAGRPLPIILERPVAINPHTQHACIGWDITRRDQALLIRVSDHMFSAKSALDLAAYVAAFAEHLRDEPDPQHVETLSQWFHEHQAYTRSLDDLARLFLRTFEMPEERAS